MEPSREELIEKRDGEDCKQWNTQMRCDWEKKEYLRQNLVLEL